MIKESSSYVRSSPKKGIRRNPLPNPKTKKPALSGRVGIGAENRRAPVTLNIKDTQRKQPRIEEELEHEDRALYDSDFQPFIDITRPNGRKEGKKLKSVLAKASPIKANQKGQPK